MDSLSSKTLDVLTIINKTSLADTMSTDILTAYEGWSVKRLTEFFIKHGISGAPVVASDDELVGVTTQTDVIKFDSVERTDTEMKNLVWMYCGYTGGELSSSDIKRLKDRASETCTVNSIMTKNVISVDISTSISDVCSCLNSSNIHHLFVTENGKLAGVITAKDILRSITEK